MPGFGLDPVEFALCVGIAAPRPGKWFRFYGHKVSRRALYRRRTRLSGNLERVYELLRNLPPGARVLDLGCAGGNFPSYGCPVAVVRNHLEPPTEQAANFVQPHAANRPFPSAYFDEVI